MQHISILRDFIQTLLHNFILKRLYPDFATQLCEPLCNCKDSEEEEHDVDWAAICAAFCVDGYTLGGCPLCNSPATSNPVAYQASRVLNTSEGWQAWCNVQCRHGHGGAACNCDRSPFSA
ncbi:uncharacterized protein LOC119189657 [Manduca sexta]|uniref:uncharacterized protein LOC119189657 n=1 Tax=Manduca sexta TaxID=7130 RepID=UPI00188F7778|nr:uncharacterized protein LOC119189657 [Manduca sexta]